MAQELDFEVAKLVGKANSSGKITQVFERSPEDSHLSTTRGHLFAIADLELPSAHDPSLAAKLVWDTVAEEYYSVLSEETPLQSLERAVYSARGKLNEFSPANTMHLVVFALIGGVTYFARIGKSALYLRRGPEVRNLLPGEEAVAIGSQPLEGNDVLVLGSSEFAKNFPPQGLPRTELLVREFTAGGAIPDLSAVLIQVKGGEVKSSLPSLGSKLPRLRLPLAKLSQPLKPLALAFPLATRPLSGVKNFFGLVSGKLKVPNLNVSLPRLIGGLVAVFLLSVVFTTWQQSKHVSFQEVDHLLSDARDQLAEAEGLVGLSNDKAEELIGVAQADLAQAGKLSPNAPGMEKLLTHATDLLNAIEKVTPVTEKNLVYDLGLQTADAQGLSLAGAGSKIYVSEEKSGSTWAITFGNIPSIKILPISGVLEMASDGRDIFFRETEKITRLDTKTGKFSEPIKFGQLKNVVSMGTYFGNLYFFVPAVNQVYKFVPIGSGYSSGRDWVKEPLSLGSGLDMAVDGEIWVLTKSGSVVRMLGGRHQTFSFSDLPTPIKQPNKIFTQPGFSNLYILDSSGRVFIFNKNGEFVRQVKGDVLSGASDLWVSTDEHTLFILSGSKIYRVGL